MGGIGPHGENNITELLLYAAVKRNVAELPTPILSSSPAPPKESCQTSLDGDHLDVKVYALPLCSTLLGYVDKAARLAGPNLEGLTTSKEATFLPETHDLSRPHQGAHQKRPSLSSLFEDAQQKRRKLKGRGGESVSNVMAQIDRPTTRHGLPSGLDHEESGTPTMLQARKRVTQSLSRSSSTMSAANSELSRPASRSGALANGKRSSLHRVESAISPRNSPIFSDVDGDYAQRNKAALTKGGLWLVCVYMDYNKRRDSETHQLRRIGQTPSRQLGTLRLLKLRMNSNLSITRHLKRQCSLFEGHFNARAISQDIMRDIVDKILSLFFSDPLVGSEMEEGGLTAFGVSSQMSAGGFDEPSAGQSSMPGSVWSPHTVKNKAARVGNECS